MSSYRSDNHASYDHTLLDSVPDPTRAEKQEGYNVGLLEGSHDLRAPSPPTGDAAPEQNGGAAVLDYSPGAVSYARKEELQPTTNEYETVEKRVPWYRTRKGMIGIVVVVLIVIIAAAVGGGVGGSHHSHKNNTNSTSQVEQTGNAQGAVPSKSSSTSTSPSTTNGGDLNQGLTSPSPSAGGAR